MNGSGGIHAAVISQFPDSSRVLFLAFVGSPPRMLNVNLIAWDNGVGLSQDIRLIARVLGESGMSVHVQPQMGRGKLRKWFGPYVRRADVEWRRLCRKPPFDVNLMLEHIRPELLRAARSNVFIPNPEWCTPKDMQRLPAMHRVLAKTGHAEIIFRARGCSVEPVGFTSDDCFDPGVARRRSFFHLAGRSSAKRTQTVLEAWQRHPEWPPLTVVQHPRIAKEQVVADNIVHRIDYVDRAELQWMQNQNLFHLCPSETEGFGHYLMEALSVGAVVLTTDAEPMNELVTPERGILIPYASNAPQNLATRYQVDIAGIEAAVETALALDDCEIAGRSRAAREFYLRNDAVFRDRLSRAVVAAAG